MRDREIDDKFIFPPNLWVKSIIYLLIIHGAWGGGDFILAYKTLSQNRSQRVVVNLCSTPKNKTTYFTPLKILENALDYPPQNHIFLPPPSKKSLNVPASLHHNLAGLRVAKLAAGVGGKKLLH